MSQPPRPVMLAILDGWGWRDDQADNAVRLARTPHYDALWASCPHAFLATSGLDVGPFLNGKVFKALEDFFDFRFFFFHFYRLSLVLYH